MATPYEKEMQRLRKLLEEVESDEESVCEDENFSDHESFSEHDSNSEIENSSSSDDSDEEQDAYIGRDKLTVWKKSKFRPKVRTPACNIVLHLPGSRGEAKNVTNPSCCISLLIDDSMLEKIVSYTNIFIKKITPNFCRERDAKETNLIELKALIGLLYLSGLHKSSHVNVRDLWATDGSGIEIFRSTMSHKRFLFLLRCLRFDDVNSREDRRKDDKLAAISEIFQMFNENCKKFYSVGEYVTIDEKLESFRGRCAFRQYIPNKPARYGIKIFALVDSRTFYTSSMEIYAGKNPSTGINHPIDIVKRLMKPLYKSGRNLTTDNWYTSYQLAKDLLRENISLVGTMRKNKREIPPPFVTTKGREVNSSIFGFQKDVTITSYVPKKGKCVVLLSTMHAVDAIDNETGDAKKPEIVTFYNMTKGAVDVVDEMSAAYSTARITNRWPMVIFYCMLNVASINSRIILLSSKNPPLLYKNRRRFIKDLAFELIKEHKSSHIPAPLHSAPSNIQPPTKRQKIHCANRCNFCPRSKDKKTKITCTSCSKFVCKEHQYILCGKCVTEN